MNSSFFLLIRKLFERNLVSKICVNVKKARVSFFDTFRADFYILKENSGRCLMTKWVSVSFKWRWENQLALKGRLGFTSHTLGRQFSSYYDKMPHFNVRLVFSSTDRSVTEKVGHLRAEQNHIENKKMLEQKKDPVFGSTWTMDTTTSSSNGSLRSKGRPASCIGLLKVLQFHIHISIPVG